MLGKYFIKQTAVGASLVVQWLAVHLAVQGTQIRFLVRENPTCRGVAGTVGHNCSGLPSQLLRPATPQGPSSASREATVNRCQHTATREQVPLTPTIIQKALTQQQRPRAVKLNKHIKILLKIAVSANISLTKIQEK